MTDHTTAGEAGVPARPTWPVIAVAIGTLLLATAAGAKTSRSEPESTRLIEWHDHRFDPVRMVPVRFKDTLVEAYPDDTAGTYFVQFHGRVREETRSRAEHLGVELLTYVHRDTYIVRMTPAQAAQLKQEAGLVRWLGIYQPAFRFSPGLDRLIHESQAAKEGDPADSESPPTARRITLVLTLFPGVAPGPVQEHAKRLGAELHHEASRRDGARLWLTIDPARIPELAGVGGVEWIEAHSTPAIGNDVAGSLLCGGTADAPASAPFGLDGTGQVVAIADTGLDTGEKDSASSAMHHDLKGRIRLLESWPVNSMYYNYTEDDGAADTDIGHGTHVAASAVGNGDRSSGTYAGLAPEAELVFHALEQLTECPSWCTKPLPFWCPRDERCLALTGMPLDSTELYEKSYAEGARIESHSFFSCYDLTSGDENHGKYTSSSDELDEFVWEHPDMLVLIAASNDAAKETNSGGTVCPPATAKNAIAVGASESERPDVQFTYATAVTDDMDVLGPWDEETDSDPVADDPEQVAAFSGRGPTVDGRIKPDLVAPGTAIVSARSQSTPDKTYFEDDLESGSALWVSPASGWARVSGAGRDGGWAWHTECDSTGTPELTTQKVDLSGGGDGHKALQFWAKSDLPDAATSGGDEDDGYLWKVTFSDNAVATDFGPYEFDRNDQEWELVYLPLMKDVIDAAKLQVTFSLEAVDSCTGGGLWIDDVRIVEGAFVTARLRDQGLAAKGSVEDDAYLIMDGTSMATPLAAGAAALVRQYYQDTLKREFVSAALVRATLINGAEPITSTDGTESDPEVPDVHQGWGRIDLDRSLDPDSPSQIDYIDEVDGFADATEVYEYMLEVTDATVPIAVTLVYHDPPGQALLRDLDLLVEDPDGNLHYANGFDATTRSDTNVDESNVERIHIESPSSTGDYTIRVECEDFQEPSWGNQPFALATRAGGLLTDERPPTDVVLALDMSGSMLHGACGTCDPKIEVLEDAVELFIALWQAVSIPGDRMGISYFRTQVDTEPPATQPLLDLETQAGALIAHVQGQTTTMWDLTAMGGGLQTAVVTLDAAVNETADPVRSEAIVLFTDGEQNVNPMVDPVTLEIVDDPGTSSSSNVVADGTVLDSGLGVEVSSIGIGAGGAYETLLQDIATSTGGVNRQTTAPDADLKQFFVEQLIDNLRDYSPQLVDYRRGTLPDRTGTETFTVNATPTQIVFKLSWPRGTRLDYRVIKDGVDVTSHCPIISGDFYRIATCDLPLDMNGRTVEAAGDWQMELSGERGTRYEAAVIVDEPQLGLHFAVGEVQQRVGTPLELSVQLLDGNRPLVDPPPSLVTATVVRNERSVDTVLGSRPGPWRRVNPGLGTTPLEAAVREAKFWSMVGRVEETVILESQGDGTYAATLPSTTVTGPYTATFRVSGRHPRVGDYERMQTVTGVVRFDLASIDMSDVRLRRAGRQGASRIYELTVVPRDVHGNYLGPGHAHLLELVADRADGDGTAVDRGDGGYTFRLIHRPGVRPVLDLRVAGQPLFVGDAVDLKRLRKSGTRRPGQGRVQE